MGGENWSGPTHVFEDVKINIQNALFKSFLYNLHNAALKLWRGKAFYVLVNI